MKRYLKLVLVCLCSLGVLAVRPARSATVIVQMSGSQFVPRDLTINLGDTVTWTNRDFTGHDTVSGQRGVPSGLWKSPLFNFGGRFSFTFTNTPVGVAIPYYCTPHWRTLGMIGSITVLPPPPTIVNPTNGESFLAGDDVVIQATPAVGGNVARMEFFANGAAIGSVTNPPYELTLTSIAAGNYALSVVAVGAQDVSSAPASVNIAVGLPEPPTIVTQPQSRTNKPGSSFQIAVEAVSKPPPSYQWLFAGGNIPGATNVTYLINSVRGSDAGVYSVAVFNFFSNQIHSVTSLPAILVLDSLPPTLAITNAPPDFTRMHLPLVYLAGTAADELGLAAVEYQVNSGPLLAVVAESRMADGTTQWSATVTLQPGNNAVRVRSVDVAGNVSAEVIRFFIFEPAAAGRGNYAGLFYDTNALAVESSGSFSLKVGNQGVFSGKLIMNGKRLPFRGQLDGALHAILTVLRGVITPLELTIDLDLGNDQVHGQLTDGAWVADLLGHRNVFQTRSRSAPQAGNYTFHLRRDDNGSVTGSDFLASIKAAGNVRFRGSFKGRNVSLATTLSAIGDSPFYFPVRPGNEVVFGWLQFPHSPANSFGTNLFWIRSGPNGFTIPLEAISVTP